MIATTTISGATTTVAPDPAGGIAATDADVPTDLPSRPVNSKPTASSSPPGFDDQQLQESPGPSESSSASSNNKSNWLPSFLPTFGVSAATQAWIYGSLVLIVLFCSGLGVYLFLARRRRLRNSRRGDYEFELLDDDDEAAEGLAPGAEKRAARGGGGTAGGAAGARKKKTRGGELYDAFAGGSDDDDDLSIDSDDDDDFGGRDAVYRDQPSSAAASGSGSGASDAGSSPIRLSEKLPGRRGRDSADDDEDGHHVIGDDDDDDDDEDDGADARPLQGGR